MRVVLTFFVVLFLTFCSIKESRNVILLQPLGDFDINQSTYVLKKIKEVYPYVVLSKNIDIPKESFYLERKRYRADSLIDFLKIQVGIDTVIVGLFHKDISTTKGNYKDWGVMGLGLRPGNACVVSTYRLSSKNKKEQLYKLVLHELWHTQGLKHCSNKECFMRDAEGGNPLDTEKEFCIKCRTYLNKKGWEL